MKPVGTARNRSTVATMNSRKTPSTGHMWRVRKVSPRPYPSRTRSRLRSIQRNTRAFSCCGFSSRAHRAGVRVMAQTVEIRIENAMVSENCR